LNKQTIDIAIRAALAGGEEIRKVYHASDREIEYKDDNSPLTIADRNANEAICDILSIESGIPILSEEGRDIPYEERKNWAELWIVDPLDGTKEFIKRNGEFTVNVALVEHGVPVMGVIYVPEKQWLYVGWVGNGAYKTTVAEGEYPSWDEVSKSNGLPSVKTDRYTVVGSRSHKSKETEDYFNKLKELHGDIDVVSMGSSLKICLVAEGLAHEYPRFAPTMEWDTCAGQAIASAAGKELIDMNTKQPMRYNRKELLNNWFLVK